MTNNIRQKKSETPAGKIPFGLIGSVGLAIMAIPMHVHIRYTRPDRGHPGLHDEWHIDNNILTQGAVEVLSWPPVYRKGARCYGYILRLVHVCNYALFCYHPCYYDTQQ